MIKQIEVCDDRFVMPLAVTNENAEALHILDKNINNTWWATDGCRNNAAVNILCSLWALGCDDPRGWIKAVCMTAIADGSFSSYQIDDFMEHVDRILPYLEGWGTCGDSDVLTYCLG